MGKAKAKTNNAALMARTTSECEDEHCSTESEDDECKFLKFIKMHTILTSRRSFSSKTTGFLDSFQSNPGHIGFQLFQKLSYTPPVRLGSA